MTVSPPKYQPAKRQSATKGKKASTERNAPPGARDPAPWTRQKSPDPPVPQEPPAAKSELGPAVLERIGKLIGSMDPTFVEGLVLQLAGTARRVGQIDNKAIELLLSILKGIQPRDPLEAMLAAQMAAIHTATMECARHLGNADTFERLDSAERALNKLARTFAMQLETLKRYRTVGEQQVTVQHVNVSEGGQAIVGNVTQPASVAAKPSSAQPSLAPADAPPSAMRVLDERKAAHVIVRPGKKDVGTSSS